MAGPDHTHSSHHGEIQSLFLDVQSEQEKRWRIDHQPVIGFILV